MQFRVAGIIQCYQKPLIMIVYSNYSSMPSPKDLHAPFSCFWKEELFQFDWRNNGVKQVSHILCYLYATLHQHVKLTSLSWYAESLFSTHNRQDMWCPFLPELCMKPLFATYKTNLWPLWWLFFLGCEQPVCNQIPQFMMLQGCQEAKVTLSTYNPNNLHVQHPNSCCCLNQYLK